MDWKGRDSAVMSGAGLDVSQHHYLKCPLVGYRKRRSPSSGPEPELLLLEMQGVGASLEPFESTFWSAESEQRQCGPVSSAQTTKMAVVGPRRAGPTLNWIWAKFPVLLCSMLYVEDTETSSHSLSFTYAFLSCFMSSLLLRKAKSTSSTEETEIIYLEEEKENQHLLPIHTRPHPTHTASGMESSKRFCIQGKAQNKIFIAVERTLWI